MSAIEEHAAAMDAKFVEIHTAIDGVSGDVAGMKTEIEKLRDMLGEITPDQKAILDGLLATAGSVAERLTALDEQTPPVPPSA